jgi:ribonuclease HII
MLTYEFEEEQYALGFRSICGVDEAGRGPLAGNVVAGAVIMPRGLLIGASMLAVKRPIGGLSEKADFARIDGNCARGFDIPARTIIGGDGKSPSIAAASIIAKVTRDRQCLLLDEKYPQYGFAKHKGYPTKEHMELVKKLGPCPEHRISFLSFTGKTYEK